MTKQIGVADAKRTFSTWVRQAEHGDAIVITRRGRPVAALISAEDLAQLQRLRAAGPDAGLAGLAGGWKGSDDLARRTLEHRRGEVRSLPELP